MSFPEFDFIAHASDVVCVSIGANLLLPVAPAIMGMFFRGIEVDADKIVEQNFTEDLQFYIEDEDLKKIGKKAVSVKRKQDIGCNAPGLFWRVMDVVFAAIGLFLLWSGWIKNEHVAFWCPLLFFPALVAAGWPFLCYLVAQVWLRWYIHTARCHAKRKKKLDERSKIVANDTEIADFVAKAKQAINTRKNGKK